MEEENDDKQQRTGDNVLKSVTSIGDSWIICRSQSHDDRVYYFNTLTGKAVWNLSDAEMKKAQRHTMSINSPGSDSIQNCPEPTEPPMDLPFTSQPPPRLPRIYNKQIINNQFSKPYTVSPFVNQPCAWSSLNHMCDGSINVVPAPVYNPNMWTVPPPVFMTPAMPPLTNPPIYHNLVHQSPQNVGCDPLSNNFRVINNFAKNGPFRPQGIHKNTQNYHNYNRMNQRFSRNFQNKSMMINDLRNVLSSRRKDANCDSRQQETSNDQGNCQDGAIIAENYLYPSDVDDEWLETFSDNGDCKLSLNPSSLLRLASGTENQDRWFIVPSTIVLINHLSLLTSLANSDEKLLVLVPMEVRRRLRSATGAAGRASRRAQRAAKWAAQQTNKVPAELRSCKDGSIVNCCLDLVQRNYYVIHLTDDSDLQKNETEIHKMNDRIPVFTISELKQYLVENSDPVAPRENITVTVFPDDGEETCPTDPPIPTNQKTNQVATNTDPIDILTSPPKEIEKEQNNSPKKQTANASVQTDLYMEPSLPSRHSSSINSTEIMDIDHTFKIDVILESDSSKEETSGQKIKLNRTLSAKKDNSLKKPSFKWRKRRTPRTSSNENGSNKSEVAISPYFQPNDNAVDYGKMPEITAQDKPFDTSTSEVISNSADSNFMFKIDRKAISDPKCYEKDIVMFKVTGDQMDDYLSKGSDEWLSRFVQIMEEALTQILQQEPYFDASIPPPWSIQEATECIKQKFKHNENITLASYTLNAVLEEISDNRGKIYSNLDPARFMQMYSYGVNLIQALRAELKDSEDVQIALESLSKLLFDIRNPNVDGTYVFPDSFVCGNESPSANTTDSMKYDEPNYFSLSPAKTKEPNLTPKKKSPQKPVEGSPPRKCNLRSAEKKKTEEEKLSNDFFTGLGLQKNIFVDGTAIKVVFNNSKTDAPALASEENDRKCEQRVQQKIIRTFNKCQDFEEKLNNQVTQYAEFAEDKNCSGSDFYLEDCDDYSDNEAEKKCSPIAEDIDTATVVSWFVERTVGPMHAMLKRMHVFCSNALEDLKRKETMAQGRKMELLEDTTKINLILTDFCKHMNSILQRKDTNTKFRAMMQVIEIENFDLNDAQATMYQNTIGKYLEQAGILLKCVNLIASEIKDS